MDSDHGQYIVTSTDNSGSLQKNSDGILYDGCTAAIWRHGVLVTTSLSSVTAASLHSTNRRLNAVSNVYPVSEDISSAVQPNGAVLDVRIPIPLHSLYRRRSVGNVPARIGEEYMISIEFQNLCLMFNVLQEEWASISSHIKVSQMSFENRIISVLNSQKFCTPRSNDVTVPTEQYLGLLW